MSGATSSPQQWSGERRFPEQRQQQSEHDGHPGATAAPSDTGSPKKQ
jgi:hypothetical protein